MNLRTIKRAGFTSALVLATAGIASADNITAGTARVIAVNSSAGNSLSNVRTEVWYKAQLYAGRSYQVSAWAVNEDAAAVNINPLEIYSDAAGTILVTSPTTTSTDGAVEGTPNETENFFPRMTTIRTTVTGVYRFRIVGNPAWPSSIALNVLLRETTLFSPWYFVSPGGGYDAFHTVHNNTAQSVTVTLTAHDSTGTAVGTTTFVVPANATLFKSTKTDLAIATGNGGTVLTHASAFGAISANTTTLSGMTGLSFDSPFTPRDSNLLGFPIR